MRGMLSILFLSVAVVHVKYLITQTFHTKASQQSTGLCAIGIPLIITEDTLM